MSNPRAFSSAACIIKLQDREIGWATGFRATENFNLFPIDVLGKLRTQRYEPVAVKYAGSFEFIHMLADPISSYIDAAGNQQLWMGGSDYQIINFQPIELTLVDQYTGPTTQSRVLHLTGWVPESRSWAISYGNVMTANCSFVCTNVTEYPVQRL